MPSTNDSRFAAEAGEHYVLYRLYREKVLAGQAPRGTDEIDLLVERENGEAIGVQVKARAKHASDGGWHMKKKHESLTRPGLIYVFLNIEKPEEPIAYILPSAKVAEVLKRAHQAWLETPGKGGKPRKDTDFRRLCPSYKNLEVPYQEGWLDAYRERWDLISQGATRD